MVVKERPIKRLVRETGIPERTLWEWGKHGMPLEPGAPGFRASLLWIVKHLRDGKGEPDEDSLQHWKKERERLKVEQLRGTLIEIVEHERELAARSSWFVDVLGALPGQIAPLVAGKSANEAKRVISVICRAVRESAYGVAEE
jgi:hypothetical protein